MSVDSLVRGYHSDTNYTNLNKQCLQIDIRLHFNCGNWFICIAVCYTYKLDIISRDSVFHRGGFVKCTGLT